ncbi:MAG: 2-amino-4-hydroxy-6-hydroxymethyldihydropteridine diphosphokinase [Rhodocyclales bacterium]|nr:2-amino-4-hydroxy-6-hydroxymethyldihydropteridine diphosphokinase [Rhodocyclales bacterium]
MAPCLPHQAVIGLGANLGDARNTLQEAIQQLRSNASTAEWQLSPLYRTAPIGSDEAQPDYINGIATFRTDLAPEVLMRWLLETERHFGRDRSHDIARNAPRTLDLDLLLYDQISMDTPLLVLPHPRLHQRAFVLRPLLDVLPDMSAPGLGQLDQYLPQVADQAIERIE